MLQLFDQLFAVGGLRRGRAAAETVEQGAGVGDAQQVAPAHGAQQHDRDRGRTPDVEQALTLFS